MVFAEKIATKGKTAVEKKQVQEVQEIQEGKEAVETKDENGKVELRYKEWESPNGIATLHEKVTENEFNAINNYWSKLNKTIEPGTIGYFIDLETFEKTDMIHGVARLKEYDTFKKFEVASTKMDYVSFGEEKSGYKFSNGSIQFKADKEAIKKESREDFIKRLTEKAKIEGSRFAYDPVKMTDDIEFLQFEYIGPEDKTYYFTVCEASDYPKGEDGAIEIETTMFEPEKVKVLKIGSKEVLFEIKNSARFIIGDELYHLYGSFDVTEDDIVQIITSLLEIK